MQKKAVVFDLFGTLVKGANQINHTAYLDTTISILAVDPVRFKEIWSSEEMIEMRATGKLSSARDILETACRRCTHTPLESSLQSALTLRLQAFKTWLEPRPDAAEVAGELKHRGFKLALMSDCTADVPVLWPDLPFAEYFDSVLFSCSLGFRKPDPRFYALTCRNLEVQPGECIYVGDGASHELTGAVKAGMRTVLIQATSDHDEVLPREDALTWKGDRIDALRKLLAVIQSEP